MSIQDDIFDIRVALKGKPEAKAFKRIEQVINRLENDTEEQHRQLTDLRRGARAFAQLINQG